MDIAAMSNQKRKPSPIAGLKKNKKYHQKTCLSLSEEKDQLVESCRIKCANEITNASLIDTLVLRYAGIGCLKPI